MMLGELRRAPQRVGNFPGAVQGDHEAGPVILFPVFLIHLLISINRIRIRDVGIW
jgi:hypothetical protein